MRRRVVTVNDKMQQGYRYVLSAPIGRDFESQFRPDLTPKQMLELGVFCGKYLTDCRDEFPASWFARAKLSPSGRDCFLNYFGVDASQPLSEWRRKGWIHPDDPRGWFQWYCRYYMGRRADPRAVLHGRIDAVWKRRPRFAPQAAHRQSCARCSVTTRGCGSGRSNTCRALWPMLVSGSRHAPHPEQADG